MKRDLTAEMNVPAQQSHHQVRVQLMGYTIASYSIIMMNDNLATLFL